MLKLSIMKEIKEREISSIPHFQPQIKNLDCQKEKITALIGRMQNSADEEFYEKLPYE